MTHSEIMQSTSGYRYGPITDAEIEQFTSGMRYPCDKGTLIDFARQRGAPKDVLDLMKQFPSEQYVGPTDVTHNINRVKH